ncbi:MAG: tRNA lysidine(34) synthetase TilS [Halobacteriovorax sp.]|nr:tRNA lysidine(34) synthetase TilS [Halobacteriovorax sp.]
MKSIRNHKLFSRLTHHVGEFWKRTCELPSGCVVALSGGVDSTLLLSVVAALGKKHGFSVRAVHVDHGTQEKQISIEKNLRKLCNDHEVELLTLRAQLDLMSSNFEASARSIRLRLLKQNLQAGEVMAFGHHIDDSLEWSLLQSLRSSTLRPSLGIPVINGRKVRPFMCLSRAQINSIHQALGLWAFEDASNQDERFARNHLRRVINTEFAGRYPNYLKHYVNRSNELAHKLGVSVFKKNAVTIKRSSGVTVIFGEDLDQAMPLVREEYYKLCTQGRSSSSGELVKMINSLKAGRKGPHNLSGGVKAWTFSGQIILTTRAGEQRLNKIWHITSQIPRLCDLSTLENHQPLVAVWNAPKWLSKQGLKSHPLVPGSESSNVVLLPWSRMVKLKLKKKLKLQWKSLNI